MFRLPLALTFMSFFTFALPASSAVVLLLITLITAFTATPTVPPEITPSPEPTEPPVTPTPVPLVWPQTWIKGFEDTFGTPPDLFSNPMFWLLVAAVLLVLALIIWLITFLAKRSKLKKQGLIEVEDDDKERDTEFTDLAVAGTIRQNGGGGKKATVRRQQPGGIQPAQIDPAGTGAPQGGSSQPVSPGGTRRIGTPGAAEPNPDAARRPVIPTAVAGSTGTVRINTHPTSAPTGTVWIVKDVEPPKPVTLNISETRAFAGVSNQRTASVVKEITIGREAGCDLVVQDETVSGRHAKIEREGSELFITDLKSSNGTTVNDKPLTANARVPLHSGDTVVVGRTTMIIRFEI